jgi:hypothetical protein
VNEFVHQIFAHMRSLGLDQCPYADRDEADPRQIMQSFFADVL